VNFSANTITAVNFSANTITALYPEVLEHLWGMGDAVAPRGQPTRELLHVRMTLMQPRCRIITMPGRDLNPFFHLAECLWVLGGRADETWIGQYNSRLKQVLDDGHRSFHAPYGERLRRWGTHAKNATRVPCARDQLLDCYSVLKYDPDSRQAVMTLWNPEWDHPGVVTKDRPCNVAVTFKLRDGRLWMSVFNRSNDFVFGYSCTNVIQFSVLQEVLATWLGVQPGQYTHYSDSLHLYERDPFSKDDNPRTPAALAGVRAANAATGDTWRVLEPFPLYEYVSPSPMTITDPRETGETVFWLLRTYAPNPPPGGLELRVSDPFLSTVEHALAAHRMYKCGHAPPEVVLEELALIPALDWRVECARWMVQRLRKRHAPGEQQTALWARMVACPAATLQYVMYGEV